MEKQDREELPGRLEKLGLRLVTHSAAFLDGGVVYEITNAQNSSDVFYSTLNPDELIPWIQGFEKVRELSSNEPEPKLSDLALKLEAIEGKLGTDSKRVKELEAQLHRLHEEARKLCEGIHSLHSMYSPTQMQALVTLARGVELRWFPALLTFDGAPLVWDSERERAEIRRLRSIVNAIAVACMRAQGCHDEIRLTATLSRIYGLCAGDPIEPRPETPSEQADPGFQGDHNTGV